jgi:nicotinamidase-related amidase
MAIWDDVLPDLDRRAFEAAGMGRTGSFGERPVLLVIDVMYGFCGDEPEPILDSIAKYRFSCGEAAWAGIAHIRTVIAACRERQIPIFYSAMERRPDNFDRAPLNQPNPRAGETDDVAGGRGAEIVAEVAPLPQDIVVVKPKASIFFGTPLMSYLSYLGADSVIVTGCVTSGCVRAAVVDAEAYNLKAVVPEECSWDRAEISHKVSLLDIHMKYGDVRPTTEVIDHVRSLPQRPFGERTPTGLAPSPAGAPTTPIGASAAVG